MDFCLEQNISMTKIFRSLPILFLVIFFLFPIGKLIYIGVDWRGIWSNNILHLLFFTIYQGLFSTVLTLLVAMFLLYLLPMKLNRFQKSALNILLLLFFLPIITIAQLIHKVQLLNVFAYIFPIAHPLILILEANFLFNIGLVTYYLVNARSTLGQEQLSAAKLDGASEGKIFKFIVLPHLAKRIWAITLLIFVYGVSDLGTILTFGDQKSKTLELAINNSLVQQIDLKEACTLGIIQMLFLLACFWMRDLYKQENFQLYSLELSEYSNLKTRGYIKSGLANAIFLFLIFPVLYYLISSFLIFFQKAPTTNPPTTPISIWLALGNSLRNASITTFVVIFLTICATAFRNSRNRFNIFYLLPFAISPALLALATIVTFGGGFFPLRNYWLVTCVLEVVIFLPFAYFLFLPATQLIETELELTLRVSGGDAVDNFIYLFLPLMKRELISLSLIVFLSSISDFIIPNFVTVGNQGTLTTLLYHFLFHQNFWNIRGSFLINLFFLIIGSVLLFLFSNNSSKRSIH